MQGRGNNTIKNTKGQMSRKEPQKMLKVKWFNIHFYQNTKKEREKQIHKIHLKKQCQTKSHRFTIVKEY